jgi:hypothetical protein
MEKGFLSKTQLLVAIVIGILAPSITAVSAFFTAKSSLQKEMSDMKYDNIINFASKKDLENVSLKLDNISQQIILLNVHITEVQTLIKKSHTR